jgi:hypothetical protein
MMIYILFGKFQVVTLWWASSCLVITMCGIGRIMLTIMLIALTQTVPHLHSAPRRCLATHLDIQAFARHTCQAQRTAVWSANSTHTGFHACWKWNSQHPAVWSEAWNHSSMLAVNMFSDRQVMGVAMRSKGGWSSACVVCMHGKSK